MDNNRDPVTPNFVFSTCYKMPSHHIRVRQEMVDFGSGQGRSDFETAGVAALRRGFRKSENAGLGQKMPFLDGH
jgi:hypothetical protein